MIVLRSIHGPTWHIKDDSVISDPDIQFIMRFDPTIYHNDRECYLWAFDTKLPSGKWLENIHFSNDLRTVSAYVGGDPV